MSPLTTPAGRIPCTAIESANLSMITLPRLLLFAGLGAVSLPAQTDLTQVPRGTTDHVLLAPLEADRVITAVRTADDERTAATLAADPARLEVILSDDLRYAHSNGLVEDKARFIESLTSRRFSYDSFAHQERTFTPAGPGIVLMTGRVTVRARANDQPVTIDLNYLAVWREENGRWRFLAWQSCRNPPPAAGK